MWCSEFQSCSKMDYQFFPFKTTTTKTTKKDYFVRVPGDVLIGQGITVFLKYHSVCTYKRKVSNILFGWLHFNSSPLILRPVWRVIFRALFTKYNPPRSFVIASQQVTLSHLAFSSSSLAGSEERCGVWGYKRRDGHKCLTLIFGLLR